MGRMARAVYPGWPRHVTQAGNRRQRTFFGDDDYRAYPAWLCERTASWACSWRQYLLRNGGQTDQLGRRVG